tara:strand:+ start:139 stop:468 length:330 start_codon:yes stop_codon:yes gene_type:complete
MARPLEFVLDEIEAVSAALSIPALMLTRTQVLKTSPHLSYNDLRMNGGISYIRVVLAKRGTEELDSISSSLVSSVLPLPEELPAPYVKRVHDLWVALVSNHSSSPLRVV